MVESPIFGEKGEKGEKPIITGKIMGKNWCFANFFMKKFGFLDIPVVSLQRPITSRYRMIMTSGRPNNIY